ncbi:methylated-DNA--[protein]-cysteine S-methyltransferase [Spiroplasma chrysopicola]|uniref:methylated-DNA--[protein]-cysteine S-methyltransferase n=1 Tax=Spiroplasma chrysopicola DF-1 TaxID=1276227 RepID=R4UJN9_9MOLU|nr:methylated-DNA--[protein]-cysteine S-methyltransferase [Spiroplasma chrysopicola]AGM25526.1 methylated-DNA-[protein]-cysteine S-methyltransferase [Spiroplasma chrysopicola DF-1]
MQPVVSWYYQKITINTEPWILACSEQGLTFVGQTEQELINYVNKVKGQEIVLIENESKVAPYIQQFEEYFNHQRQSFTLPLDLIGTGFQKAVWKSLLTIPYGQTQYYQAVAKTINRPQATRAVGHAIGTNPLLIFVPCHRVIGKNKKLTGFRAGLGLKNWLLEFEKNN